MTTKFCVVGSPISHSLSPRLHEAAYRFLGLDFSYTANEVQQGSLLEFVSSNIYEGLSVTMPLKEEAFKLATSHNEDAKITGVVNTLIRSDGSWLGANTDVAGLQHAFEGLQTPQTVVVLGSGATAKSALLALSRLYPGCDVALIARNQDAAGSLSGFGLKLGLEIRSANLGAEELLDADLVLNLVPAGAMDSFWLDVSKHDHTKAGVLFDASYNPWPSNPAIAWGNGRIISGIEMLIWQAIEQVQLFSSDGFDWSGVDRQRLYEVMKQAVEAK